MDTISLVKLHADVGLVLISADAQGSGRFRCLWKETRVVELCMSILLHLEMAAASGLERMRL
jgi:hypothetical protein